MDPMLRRVEGKAFDTLTRTKDHNVDGGFSRQILGPGNLVTDFYV